MSYNDVRIIRSPEATKDYLKNRGYVSIVAIVNHQTKEIIKYDCCVDVGDYVAECRRVPTWFLPYKSKECTCEVHLIGGTLVEYDGVSDVEVVLQRELQKFIQWKHFYDQFMNHWIKTDGDLF